MNSFFEKNKTFLGIIIGALIIGGFVYFSRSPAPSSSPTYQPPINTSPSGVPQQTETQTGSTIDFKEASNHIGEYATVRGRVDNVFTSAKGNTFLNFCPNYKTCPFSATIFNSDSYKFANLKQYEGRIVEITGLIKTYQGRAEIIINDPSQIK